MSETDEGEGEDEREEIRREKARRLRERLGEDGSHGGHDEPVSVEGGDHLSELVTTNDVVLVDFYADWCGPCKALEPVVESIAADTAAVVAKVDIDRHRDIAAEANVRGVPTIVVYADGEPVERLVGVQEESRLRSIVERVA